MGRSIPVNTPFSHSHTHVLWPVVLIWDCLIGALSQHNVVCVCLSLQNAILAVTSITTGISSARTTAPSARVRYLHTVFDLSLGLCRHLLYFLMFFCVFQTGRVECDVITCPSVSCDETSVHSRSCCPVCPTSTHHIHFTHTYYYFILIRSRRNN